MQLARTHYMKITITTNEGRAITWSSCGKVGFKGAKRSTSFAAQTCGQRCAEDSVEKGVPSVRVLLKGLGAGRQTAVEGTKVSLIIKNGSLNGLID